MGRDEEGRVTLEVVEPHGFCAGVDAALRKARSFCAESKAAGREAYCLHEIVHNPVATGELEAAGLKFVDSVEEVPEGASVLFSAHGVSPAVRATAARRNLRVTDATCPFVQRVHEAARAYASRGMKVVVIGKRSHAEVEGILGEAPGAFVAGDAAEAAALAASLPPGTKTGVVSQTTMDAREVGKALEALSARLDVETAAQVCAATKVRQEAAMAFDGDLLVVLGGANSSNTRRLCEVARCRAVRAGTLEEVEAIDFGGARRIGVTSGASTPESFLVAALETMRRRIAAAARD